MDHNYQIFYKGLDKNFEIDKTGLSFGINHLLIISFAHLIQQIILSPKNIAIKLD